jgi:molybdopterin-synthase adenylyltransferase
VLAASDGQIYLLRGGDADFAVADTPLARALLERLDGRHRREDLARELAAAGAPIDERAVDDAVATLYGLGLVEDAAGDDALDRRQLQRYEGQLRYFADLAPPESLRSSYQRRLRDSRVVILGLGGLGSWAAYALACAGLGRIDLVDGDAVELGNLNRQILYREADIGESKALAAARALAAFNSDTELRPLVRRLESERAVEAAVRGADFVVDAADWPPHEIERWVNAACFRNGIPYLTMSQFPPLGRVGPTYVPGETGCLACQEAGFRRDFPLFDELVELRSRRPSPAATFGPACALLGGQAAADAVHLLSGLCRPASLGAALLVDLRTMEVTREEIAREPGCPVCGDTLALSGAPA